MAQIRMQKDGRKHSESETFSTKKAAQAWARNRETDLERDGLPTPESSLTIAEACTKYY